MPSLITTISALKKTTRKKQRQKSKNKNLNFTAKTHLNLKSPSNNVKLQSDKTLTTQIYFSLTTHQMGFFLNETR